jgi:hypothetical protein
VRVLKPQQLDERTHVSIRVLAASSQLLYSKASAAGNHDLDLPPPRHGLHGRGDVLRTHDEGRAIEDHSVDSCLTGEPSQAVAIGLDLVAVDRAVDDCDVDAHLPSTEAQLLQEGDIFLSTVSIPEALQQH